jgi:hypothetical protein
MKIFWHIFVLATVLATFSKIWANFSKSSGRPARATEEISQILNNNYLVKYYYILFFMNRVSKVN